MGLDAGTGRMLWRWGKSVSKYGANIPFPLFADGLIYAASAGTGGGAVRLKSGNAGAAFDELYFEFR